ncbi:membrane hypothetical protein [Phycicoccus elongatus Lp2]|uniref:Uncharacterized protein n=1 Tax=Phycicoccus elongatus Lp2 TaxID=1193181 RepID=N0E186_9MICO|nr:membrane hypothetical protein [Phycicoccus elongatus Lp2]
MGGSLNLLGELSAFARAALLAPVERDHSESDEAFRRRRVVAALTLVVGACVLAWALRITPGDSLFYVATLALALVWVLGAFASGRLHLGRAHRRDGGSSRAVVQSLTLGLLLLAIFLVGAVAVARIPVLREPVDRLLAHAAYGSLSVVADSRQRGSRRTLLSRRSLCRHRPTARRDHLDTRLHPGDGCRRHTPPRSCRRTPRCCYWPAAQSDWRDFGPRRHPPHLVTGNALPPPSRPGCSRLIRVPPGVLWLQNGSH